MSAAGSFPATPGLIGPGDLWYKDAVIYSLNVETFQDSDGDGIGDFPGLTSRLDYLHALGITCIWLHPFYPSPGLDNRYDVADYYGVDPRLGTLGDFVDFLRVARERGIRVMIDLVVNHTSDQHPWFQSARSDPHSRYRDYYLWAPEAPSNAGEGMMFPGIESSTWTWDETARAFYFHRFYRHQPDLNLGNPAVRDEVRKIMGFWLELGVSGFRVDAAPYLIERKGASATLEMRRPHSFFRYMRGFLSWRRGDAALLAEANVTMPEVEEYVGAGDKLHMLFGFFVNQYLWLSLATRTAAPLERALGELAAIPPTAQWANFLRNHDELDLSRLTAADRARVFESFAPDASMQLYGRGIRRRVATMLRNDRAWREMAHSLMLAIAGTPVLYYGDEIGMGDDLSLGERQSVRTPMQWEPAANGGFSSATADRLVRPVVSERAFEPTQVNVAAQQHDPNSFLNWLQRAIGVRKTCRELSWGRTTVARSSEASVCALRCEWQGAVLVTVHNLAPDPCRVRVDANLDGSAGAPLTEVLGDRDYAPWTGDDTPLDLAGFGYRWIRRGPHR
jgi:maltose alpha-D-glucosyltransferase/alpha-amylase